MANTTDSPADEPAPELSKQQLQREMARKREALAETIGEIKETVEDQVDTVKKGVSDIFNFRDEFQKDPLVMSLGALSAGFALGYTVGYAHKNSKGGKQNQVTAFADTMIDQLSTMGQGMVLPALDAKISELFGFDFSAMLAQAGQATNKSPAKKKPARRVTAKPPANPRALKPKPAATKKPVKRAKS
ncbi:MAG: hypothetical protein H0X08_06710 [Blastocatellia bacterium]|nr:hypothetical protein [Blastocatellia bacterium]